MTTAARQERPTTGAGELTLPSLPARLAQIDVLKGLAIVAVLFLHSLPVTWLHDGVALLHIGQAVPVFVVLMGLNGTASLWRHRDAGLRRLYSRQYVVSRIDRLYVPFLLILVVACVVAAARSALSAGGVVSGLVAGTLPFGGPGNYYVTFAFEFALLLPAFFWAFRRAPRATVVAAFVVAAAFDVAAAHAAVLNQASYVYSAALPRFAAFLAVGAMLADRMLHGRGAPRWWWLAGLVGVGYLVLVRIDQNAIALGNQDWRPWGQTFLSAFYPLMLVVAGLRWLPRTATSAGWALVAVLGTASYEIFLVQILWFGALGHVSLLMVLPSVVLCCAAGWAFHRALRRAPSVGALAPREARAEA